VRALALWPARRRSGVIDHPEPAVSAPTDVLVRVLEVGICGTDAELCDFLIGAPPAGSDFLIPGHEAIGEVVEVGAGVSSLAPGDLVVPSVRRPCPHPGCAACRSSNQDFCETGDFTERGIRAAHGFLAERIVEDERYLYRLPRSLRGVGVLVEPLTIAEKGLRQYLAVQRRLPWLRDASDREILAGRRALVLGAGPVGILGAMLLRERGCEVWVYSREQADDPRAALIESTGARYLEAARLPPSALGEEVGGIDLVYEAAGSAALTLATLPQLGRNAALVTTGVPRGGAHVDLAADDLLTGMVVANQLLVGTVNASHADFVAAVRDLEEFANRWAGATAGIVTGRRALGEFCECAMRKRGVKEVIILAPDGDA
jgi:threonine dehydrogenase-like Zn-dependent dehydrogenase